MKRQKTRVFDGLPLYVMRWSRVHSKLSLLLSNTFASNNVISVPDIWAGSSSRIMVQFLFTHLQILLFCLWFCSIPSRSCSLVVLWAITTLFYFCHKNSDKRYCRCITLCRIVGLWGKSIELPDNNNNNNGAQSTLIEHGPLNRLIGCVVLPDFEDS